MAEAPLRIGEASCSPYECVTRSGTLIIPNTPFDVDKSKHAPRQIPISATLATSLRELAGVSKAIAPLGQWIYRFDQDAIQDDVRCNALLGELLRLQTGEPFGRLQSLRANAYQEFLWPGWRSILNAFLNGETTAQICSNWISSGGLEERWIRVIYSSVVTGHGAVDPGLLHYAGAWALIYAIHYEGTLARLQPGQGWFKRFKIARGSMDRARLRTGALNFDPWRWLEKGRFDASNIDPLYSPAKPSSASAGSESASTAPPAPPIPTIHSESALVYLVLRALTLNGDSAAHESGISGRVQEIVEPHCIGNGLVAGARKRNKKSIESTKRAGPVNKPNKSKGNRFGIQDTATVADLELLLEDHGQTTRPIVQWALALNDAEVTTLDALFRRDAALISDPACVREHEIWEAVTRGMPSLIKLQLRFGKGEKFLTGAQEIVLRCEGKPWFLDSRHPDRGQLPDLMIRRTGERNEVNDRRMTSVVRLILLARLALNRAEAHYLKRTSGASAIHSMPSRHGPSET